MVWNWLDSLESFVIVRWDGILAPLVLDDDDDFVLDDADVLNFDLVCRSIILQCDVLIIIYCGYSLGMFSWSGGCFCVVTCTNERLKEGFVVVV